MKTILTFGAAALALSIALPAAAQTAPPASGSMEPPASSASPTPPASTEAAPPAANSGTATDATATAPALAVGQSVKDNTGAVIGQITQLKPDASGKQVATIKMGSDTFAVDGANLGVKDGSAMINATQAELQGMIKKSAPQKKGG